jgi:hypothetical protein
MAYRKRTLPAMSIRPRRGEVPVHRPVTYRVTQYPAGTHIAGNTSATSWSTPSPG